MRRMVSSVVLFGAAVARRLGVVAFACAALWAASGSATAGGTGAGLIAYSSYPGCGIYVKDVKGGPARRVTKSCAAAEWSPDGKWIAFVDSRHIPKSHPCRYDDRVECPAEIYVVRPDGTRERRVTPPGVGTRVPSWSPDSSRLVFARDFPQQLYVIGLDGRGLRRLTSSQFDYEGSPSWSANGREVAFIGGDDVYVINLVGHQRRLTNSKAKRDGPFRSVAWSPDGRWIAYSGYRPYFQGFPWIFLTDPRGKRHRVVSRTDLPLLGSYAWSPDSTRLVYQAGSEADEKGLWTIAVATGRPRQVARVSGFLSWNDPSWSPSGTRLVVGQSDAGNPKGIWVMNADGTGKKRFVVRGVSAVWQPAGR
jgi:Tol biopolymer transport system component